LKAVQLDHFGPAENFHIVDIPIPEPQADEVLIKVEKTAICGTDVHIYNWDEWSQRTIKPGLTIGHEFVGRIVELGDGVTGYKAGHLEKYVKEFDVDAWNADLEALQ